MKPIAPLSLLLLLLLACASACGPADAPAEQDRERLTGDLDRYTRLSVLPRHFEGTFDWDDGTTTQDVEVWFEQVSLGDDGRTWVAMGHAIYRTSYVTRIDVRARIRPDTGRFRMWESNPDTSHFVTAGVHRGKISEDFERIEATWNGENDEQGQLRLSAASDP